jgi:transcription initiation factor TFIIIB Brf1 subunit/transcription initiation factor TFIIB
MQAFNNNNNIQNIDNDSCDHDNTINDNGIISCMDCGEEIEKKILHEKEWNYYGHFDTKHSSDPNRVQSRKLEERNIYKDVENMNFSDKIVSGANEIYNQVTKGQIFRGNSRKAIIFACIFHSYKLSSHPQTHEKLIQIFGLNRKLGLKGLKHVNLNAPKDSKIHTTYITPVNLLEDIMQKFSATDSQKAEVIELYHKIKNKSSKLNRSRPQSVACGLTYYWICNNGINVSLKEFTKKAALSELTINKIAKEVAEVVKKL